MSAQMTAENCFGTRTELLGNNVNRLSVVYAWIFRGIICISYSIIEENHITYYNIFKKYDSMGNFNSIDIIYS